MKLISTLLMTLALGASLPLIAIAADDMSKTGMADMKSSGAVALSEGEVKKIDKDAGKITIKHGPLANLDMPGMTMVFRVKDSAMLEQVKAGDKIRFTAEKVGGALTVTVLEAVK
jgi:Cu(I)/Ag(I) efflux system protein CusF